MSPEEARGGLIDEVDKRLNWKVFEIGLMKIIMRLTRK